MIITKNLFLHATAEAMSTKSATDLFDNDPEAFDMFSLFSYCLFKSIEKKDITQDAYNIAVSDLIVDILPDTLSETAILKNLALIIFATQIWKALEKPGDSNQKNSDFDDFKSVLKSKK